MREDQKDTEKKNEWLSVGIREVTWIRLQESVQRGRRRRGSWAAQQGDGAVKGLPNSQVSRKQKGSHWIQHLGAPGGSAEG